MENQEVLEMILKKLTALEEGQRGLEEGQRILTKGLAKVEDKIDYLTSVVDEALVLHDELEERVKVLESKVV